MKVYGLVTVTGAGSVKRVIVAASSQREAVRLINEQGLPHVTLNFFRTYASPTRNALENEVALSAPGTVFVSPAAHRDFQPLKGA